MKSISERIQKAYLSDDYKEVISILENLEEAPVLSLGNPEDRNILQALVDSYSSLEETERTNHYVDQAIYYLKRNKDGYDLWKKDLDFYYSQKVSNCLTLKRYFLEYKLWNDYIQLGGNRKEFIEIYNVLEKNLFKGYLKFNRYFNYFFIAIIVLKTVFSEVLYEIVDLKIWLVFVFVSLTWIIANSISLKVRKSLFRFISTRILYLWF